MMDHLLPVFLSAECVEALGFVIKVFALGLTHRLLQPTVEDFVCWPLGLGGKFLVNFRVQLLIIGIYYEWAMGHPPPSKLTKTSPTKIPEIILFKVGCTYPVNARGPIVDSQISARFFGPGTKTGA